MLLLRWIILLWRKRARRCTGQVTFQMVHRSYGNKRIYTRPSSKNRVEMTRALFLTGSRFFPQVASRFPKKFLMQGDLMTLEKLISNTRYITVMFVTRTRKCDIQLICAAYAAPQRNQSKQRNPFNNNVNLHSNQHSWAAGTSSAIILN